LPYDLPLLDIFRTAKVRPSNENTKIKGVFSEKGFSGYLGGSRAVVEGRWTEEKKGQGIDGREALPDWSDGWARTNGGRLQG